MSRSPPAAGYIVTDDDQRKKDEETDKLTDTDDRPLDELAAEGLVNLEEEIEKRRKPVPVKAFTDLFKYLFFLAVFSFVTFAPRNANGYYVAKAITEAFVDQDFTSPVRSYLDIHDLHHYFLWLEDVFLEEITPASWYNGDRFRFEDSHFVANTQNRVVGPVRFLQKRVERNGCSVAEIFSESIFECNGPFSNSAQEKDEVDNLSYKYRTTDELNSTIPWVSPVTNFMYFSDGYAGDIPSDRSSIRGVISRIKNERWIDTRTRFILIEFVTYNANLDMFCQVKLNVELLAAGQLVPTHEVMAVDLLSSTRVVKGEKGLFDWFLLVMEVFMFALVYQMLIRLGDLYVDLGRRKFWKDVWNVMDAANYTLFIITFFCRVATLLQGTYLSGSLTKATDQGLYFDVHIMIFLARLTTDVNSFNSVLCFLKAFKFMRVHRSLAQFTSTLGRSASDISVMCVILFILLCGYGTAYHMAFGYADQQYRDFPESIFTLLLAALGDRDLDSLRLINRYLGPLLFSSYIIAVMYVILSMLLKIVNTAYDDVRYEVKYGQAEDPVAQDMKHTMAQVLHDLVWYYMFRKTMFEGARAKMETIKDGVMDQAHGAADVAKGVADAASHAGHAALHTANAAANAAAKTAEEAASKAAAGAHKAGAAAAAAGGAVVAGVHSAADGALDKAGIAKPKKRRKSLERLNALLAFESPTVNLGGGRRRSSFANKLMQLKEFANADKEERPPERYMDRRERERYDGIEARLHLRTELYGERLDAVSASQEQMILLARQLAGLLGVGIVQSTTVDDGVTEEKSGGEEVEKKQKKKKSKMPGGRSTKKGEEKKSEEEVVVQESIEEIG